jgi:hypothetical protein
MVVSKISYVNLTDIIPSDSLPWVVELFKNDFSWGDNDHTLISPSRFKEIIETEAPFNKDDDIEDYDEIIDSILNKLDLLIPDDIYVDLEN